MRTVILEHDLVVLDENQRGVIAASDPTARTARAADLTRAATWGWEIALFGLAVPFVSVWSLLPARALWRGREHAHALGIAMLTAAVLAFETSLVLSPPVEQSWRFAIGIAVTLAPIVIAGWAVLTGRPHPDRG